jgi:hypothetical protein
MGSSCQCRVSQFRHRRLAPAEFAGFELPLFDLLSQLDSRDRYHRVVEKAADRWGQLTSAPTFGASPSG